MLPWIRKLRAAFPDITFEVVTWFTAETRYTVFFRAQGTHTGPFETEIGTARPTGKPFVAHGIEVFDLRDGKIVGVWEAWDWRHLYAALGAQVLHRCRGF